MVTIHVITGPPCAGKSYHVQANRGPADLVIDLDAIAHALGYPDQHIDHDQPHAAVTLARQLRYDLLGQVLNARVKDTTWIIDTEPTPKMLTWYSRARAEVTTLDPGRDVCHARADQDQRPTSTHAHIDAWYDSSTSARASTRTRW